MGMVEQSDASEFEVPASPFSSPLALTRRFLTISQAAEMNGIQLIGIPEIIISDFSERFFKASNKTKDPKIKKPKVTLSIIKPKKLLNKNLITYTIKKLESSIINRFLN